MQTGEWLRLHNEELNDLYSSNQKEWVGWRTQHVWRRWELHTGFWWGSLKERDNLEDPDLLWL